ncbi:MAG: serine hydrolase [Rickettsiales bacterium]|nr:serine hydrolase [Rickettsiales bacterium]
MPKNPLILDELSNSNLEGRSEEIWPIMSSSKAFCGALITSSAHEFFGEKGVEATVKEALEQAKIKHHERTEKIDDLISALEKSQTADLKIATLLNHSTGLNNNNDVYFEQPQYEAKSKDDYFSEMRIDSDLRDKFSYSNNGYYLLEELVNLTSEYGYHQEMQNRIISKLGLNKTKFISDTPESEKDKIGNSAFVTKDKENPFIISPDYTSTYPIRELSAAAGVLTSSANDLKTFFTEYNKMILGLENRIADFPNHEIADLYRKYLVFDGGMHHSLGMMLRESENGILIGHPGGHAGNSCESWVKTNTSLEDFKEGKISEEKISDFEFELKKKSALGGQIKNALLAHVLEGYFAGKIAALNEAEQEEINSKITHDKTKKLKALSLLPENYYYFERQVAAVTENRFFEYLKENNLLDEHRIVDERKLEEHYQSNKAGFYNRILDQESLDMISDIFASCNKANSIDKITTNEVEQQSVEKFLKKAQSFDDLKEEEKKSWQKLLTKKRNGIKDDSILR